jgi:lipopolysaccharide export system protein LptA
MFPARVKEPLMKHLLAVGCLLGAFGQVAALSTDSEQPMEVEADFAEFDDATGNSLYRGNVVVVQGSMRITGDVLTIDYTDTRELDLITIEGRPAHFQQRPDNEDVDVVGEAKRIEYHGREDLLYLFVKAKVTKGERLFKGDRIVYDSNASTVRARAEPREVEGPRERVKVVIPPKKDSANP